MNAAKDKTLALAASIRLPNIPSVWSNVLTGALLASLLNPLDLGSLAIVLLAATALYLAGNLLNDWADRNWDASHRPERALPSGLFPPTSYLVAGTTLVGIALIGNAAISPAVLGITLALTTSVVIYIWSHKRCAWSVVPMAACRALLPLMGYAAMRPSDTSQILIVASLAAAHFAYVMILSSVARAESKPTDSNHKPILWFGFLAPPAILAAAVHEALPHIGDQLPWPEMVAGLVLGLLPYAAWTMLALTRYRKPIPSMVSALLAGIPLVDSLLLFPPTLWLLFSPPADPNPLPLLLLCPLFIWLLAFLAGRLLQRVVPAT